MEKLIYDHNNGFWYELQGDYYYPLFPATSELLPPLGKWGKKRVGYLREYRKSYYARLVASGKLADHLIDIDTTANEMFDLLMRQLAEQQGINEQMKAQDQLAWIGTMNNVRHTAEEIVDREIICA